MKSPHAIRLRLAQIEVLPGRPWENAGSILRCIAEARSDGVDVIAFPELAIPGYLLGDEWERPAFLRECEACGRRIMEASAGIVAAFGNVGLDWSRRNEDGRVRKYNALFVAQDGVFLRPEGGVCDFAIKTLMPNYREFDDSRHFFDLRKLAMEERRAVDDLIAPIRTRAGAIGAILCEDAWDSDYAFSPLRVLAAKGVDFFLNASCSPYTFGKNRKRSRVFSAVVAELGRPLAYVNNVGVQNNGKTVFTFDGASCVYDGRGGHVSPLAPFEEGAVTLDIPRAGGAFGTLREPREEGIRELCDAVLYGIRKFGDGLGAGRVVVGISGGIDSALVAALFRRLLAPEDLLLVNMPGEFTSPTTRSLARDLAANLGALYAEAPIGESVAATMRQLHGLAAKSADGRAALTLRVSGAGKENIQARDRSSRLLAGIAASFGGVFTCNANKSEATVGYTTLYGDLAGFFAPIADLWKGEVYAMARHLNEAVYGAPAIPRGCFDLVPSAELSAEQNVDEGQGDPLRYAYHDCLFRSWVEAWNRTTPEEILAWYLEGALEANIGYDGRVSASFSGAAEFIADLERWWNQYQGLGVAKRLQAPPILAVKRRAFGFDHREAQLGARYTRRYLELKRQALAEPARGTG